MLSPKAKPEVVENEKKLVRRLVGLTDTAEIEINDTGWTSRVYIINLGEYVVKFPRHEEVKKEYEQEVKILKLLEQVHSPVKIPKLRWIHPNHEYLGYEGIVGQDLSQVAANVTAESKRQIGRDVGAFLKQLHSLQFDGGLDMTVDDEIKQFQDKYKAAQRIVERDFSESEQARLAALVSNDLPKELRKLGANRVVCHGDLGYWNMIVGSDGSIGLIDFGDIGHYDQSKDFIGLKDTGMLEEALKVYGNNANLRSKIAMRQKVLALLDLPYFMGTEDEAGIAETVQRLKAAITNAR